MAKLQEMYLTSFFIGEGFSGFVPSIIALAQGVGGNPECHNKTDGSGTEAFTPDPRFPVDVFFYCLFVFTLLSALAYYLLNKDLVIKDAKSLGNESGLNSSSNSKSTSSREGSLFAETSVFELPSAVSNTINDCQDDSGNNNLERLRANSDLSHEGSPLLGMSNSVFFYLVGLQIFVCFLSNGVFPSIQSYSCLPYGNVTYHLAVTLSNMANPAVCFLAFFIPPPSKRSISTIAVLSVGVSAYVMVTAVSSPEPPLVGQRSGEVLLVRMQYNDEIYLKFIFS